MKSADNLSCNFLTLNSKDTLEYIWTSDIQTVGLFSPFSFCWQWEVESVSNSHTV